MNKELEEAIKELRILNLLGLGCSITEEIKQKFATILNYIDNSIPKEVVEKKIKMLKDTLDLLKADKKVAKYKILAIEMEIQDLQELLEGK